jgi:hypothetical protein
MLPPEKTADVVDAVIANQERMGDIILPERYKVRAARSCQPVFYPGLELIEVLLEDERGLDGCFALVRESDNLAILSGQSSPIHNLNLSDRLTLKSDVDMEIAYLRFFCAWLMADEGPFSVVESIEEATARLQDAPANVGQLFSPISFDQDDASGRTYNVCMVYGGVPFKASLRVGATGSVMMLDDKPLADKAIFARWDIRAGARFLPA